jgi:hypothetical protein
MQYHTHSKTVKEGHAQGLGSLSAFGISGASDSAFDRAIREENRSILAQRWAYTQQASSHWRNLPPAEAKMYDALSTMTLSLVEALADTGVPLFEHDVQTESMWLTWLQSAARGGLDHSAQAGGGAIIERENLTILMNRWHAAQSEPLWTELVYGLGEPSLELWQQLTFHDICILARHDKSLVRFRVNEKFLQMAAGERPLNPFQRTILATLQASHAVRAIH